MTQGALIEADLSPEPAQDLDIELPAWCVGRPLVYCLRLPKETPSNNSIKQMHWMAYRQLRCWWKQKLLARLPARQQRPATLESSALVVVRRCAGQLDWDNAYGGLKPVLDCLVAATPRNPDGLGLVRDDSPRHMPYPPLMLQRAAPPGAGSTELLVFELAQAP